MRVAAPWACRHGSSRDRSRRPPGTGAPAPCATPSATGSTSCCSTRRRRRRRRSSAATAGRWRASTTATTAACRRMGEGAAWARRALAAAGVPDDFRLLLLTQPRWLGTGVQSGQLLAGVRGRGARRRDRRGQQHLRRPPQLSLRQARLRADRTRRRRDRRDKVFHVSPFQPVAGRYAFSFDIRAATPSPSASPMQRRRGPRRDARRPAADR